MPQAIAVLDLELPSAKFGYSCFAASPVLSFADPHDLTADAAMILFAKFGDAHLSLQDRRGSQASALKKAMTYSSYIRCWICDPGLSLEPAGNILRFRSRWRTPILGTSKPTA